MAIGGDILIKLAADVAELRQGFDQARREAKKTQESIAAIGDSLKTFVSGVIVEKIVGTLADMARSVADIGDKAQALQLTTDQFQGIANAAVAGGLGVDGMTSAFNKLNSQISAAVEGNKKAIEHFESLGVKIIDTNGQLRSTADIAADASKALLNLDQANQRAGKSTELFGSAGSRVLPVMAQLGDGADLLAAKLAARGGIASPDTIEKLNKFFSAIESSKQVLTAQGGTAFANLIGPDTGDNLTKRIEAIGAAIVKVSEMPIVQKGLGFFIETALGPAKLLSAAFLALVDVAERFDDIWATALAHVRLGIAEWDKGFLESINNVAAFAARGAEAFVNHYIRTLNAFVTDIAQQLPDWAKKMFGITGEGVTVIEPIKIDFKPVGVETLLDATVAVQNAQEQLERVRVFAKQDAAQKSEAAARVGKLPAVNAPGASNPPPRATGGSKKKDPVAEMLDELVRRQAAEEHALANLKAASVDTPLREINRAVDLQKKIEETIAKVASKEKGGASPELVERITAQVTATENAAFATKQYEESLRLAQATEKEFGNGKLDLNERLSELKDALDSGRLSLDAYNAAVKSAHEKQTDQALSAARAKGGVDALAAGFEQAALRFAKANDQFALGGQLFDGVVNLMDGALTQFVENGTIQFDKLLQSFIVMLAQMALRAAASEVFGAITGALGGGGGAPGVASSAGGAGASPVGFLSGLLSLFGGGFAKGSTNDLIPGVGYTVGEFGPEQFVPRVPGQIMTADDMSQNWGGGSKVSQTINFSLGVQQTVRAEIATMLPQIAQAGAAAAQRERERGGRYKQSFSR